MFLENRMKSFLIKNFIFIISIIIFVIITVTTIFITKEYILIPFFLFIGILILILLLFQRKSFEKELSLISNTIQNIMDNKLEEFQENNSDELNSKIEHQLNKLSSWVLEYNKKIVYDKKNIEELITEIAHQLRTPIFNIKTYSNLLLDENISENNRKKYINAIIESEEKIDFLIESFIKISRFENKIIQIKKVNSDLKETILKALLHIYEKAKAKNIDILFNEDEIIKVEHDPNWIEEAVYNILDNSVKYSPEDSKIEIKLLKNDMFTEIIIRDYGIGIELGEENKIFKRFYRGENTSTEEGYGIGLYLTREILLKHDGFIKIKSENQGISMHIYLN